VKNKKRLLFDFNFNKSDIVLIGSYNINPINMFIMEGIIKMELVTVVIT
jgi:hypothetical protein